jgi:predicted dehydrogenase
VRVSGGVFFDMTIHDLDMARIVTGSEVSTDERVRAARAEYERARRAQQAYVTPA